MKVFKKCLSQVIDWCDENFDGVTMWAMTALGVILQIAVTIGITFASYCLVGYVLYYVYNHIAWEINWPQFNYWFFVACAYGIVWIIRLFKYRDKHPVITTTTNSEDN